jgi:hypothetical protein
MILNRTAKYLFIYFRFSKNDDLHIKMIKPNGVEMNYIYLLNRKERIVKLQ